MNKAKILIRKQIPCHLSDAAAKSFLHFTNVQKTNSQQNDQRYFSVKLLWQNNVSCLLWNHVVITTFKEEHVLGKVYV